MHPMCSLQHYLQQSGYGNSLSIHWWMKGFFLKCDTHTMKQNPATVMKKEIQPLAITWMDREGTIRKVRQIWHYLTHFEYKQTWAQRYREQTVQARDWEWGQANVWRRFRTYKLPVLNKGALGVQCRAWWRQSISYCTFENR